MYGNLKNITLNAKLATLKHELNICNMKLRDNLKRAECSSINWKFNNDPKQVFRSWRGKGIEIKDPPSTEKIKEFWAGIWGKDTPINTDSQWYKDLQGSYCEDVVCKKYTITKELFDESVRRLPNNKAPGRDMIIPFWIKKLSSVHDSLFNLLSKALKEEIEIPDWLAISRTLLLPKNIHTHLEKNYRPIACQNITYKLYTRMLNHFVEDHCISNKIITLEQAGGKKGSWGCIDQLLINKMVLDEVRLYRRNLFTMWFDYRKAFDSISHHWLLEALKLAKLPENIVTAITNLTKKWATKVYLQTKDSVSVTDTIRYLTGILQGDCLSLLLFIICINPLSHLLNQKCEGYLIGPPNQRNTKLNHLLFVDDLKTYAQTKAEAESQLQLITQFTNDIGMQFGTDKCAYMYIERGQRKTIGETITMNGLEMNELKEEDSYKYLGADEDIAYNGEINKERVTKEYLNRVRKIWNSELYSRNKVLAHNIFAIPVFTLTFGILDWTKEEIQNIDVKTRKILTCTGNFHRNSSVDRLYANREDGGRGLNSIYDIYITRLIAVVDHLNTAVDTNRYLKCVQEHETDKLIRVAETLKDSLDIEQNGNGKVSTKVKGAIKRGHKSASVDKKQHGFINRKQNDIQDYNKQLSNSWLKLQGTTSHAEGYIFAIQEQEINTRALKAKREHNGEAGFNNQCRYCNNHLEDIFHLLCSCPFLAASVYLPARHDQVAIVVYNSIIRQHFPSHPNVYPRPVWSQENLELWWDNEIKTAPKVKYNKPDIVVWRKESKECLIIDICIPLDENIHRQEKEKLDKYLQLSVVLKRLYPEYSYKIIPIVLGATGAITNSLKEYLTEVFEANTIKHIIPKLQEKALIGSMRVVKTAMSMRK